MKKRLCLFMMLLLLFMSVGCSQTTPQASETLVTVTSKTDAGSTTAVEPNDEDNFHTDADSTTAVEPNDEDSLHTDGGIPGSDITPYTLLADDPDTGLDDRKPDNAEDDSLPESTAADLNEDDSGTDDELNPGESASSALSEDGSYTSKEDVALYIYLYGHLPPNFITKKEAENLGWNGGSLEPYVPGMCIGGNHFGNYEGILPEKEGRSYTECDIDTLGASKRGAKRIVFSNDGLIYYTEDHYKSFELLYGEADS